MTAYVDTSALMRVVLGEAGALGDLADFDHLVSSELTMVESLRTLDRMRQRGALTGEQAAERRAIVGEWLEAIDLVLLRPPILNRAGDPLPAPLGTLDAIHLVTALTWRERLAGPLLIATHDTALGAAARAYGFEVRGL